MLKKIYGRKLRLLEDKMRFPLYAIGHLVTNFVTAVSYAHKIFIAVAFGVNLIKRFATKSTVF
jgi:hypothetical protein